MRRNKLGLADLKVLRKQTESSQIDPPKPVKRVARKRSPFLPPADAPVSADKAASAPTVRHRSPPQRPEAVSEMVVPDAAQLSEADRRLFRSAVRYVDKLKDPGRLLLAPVPTAPADLLKRRRMRAAGMDEARRDKPASRGADLAAPSNPPASGHKPAKTARALSDTYASAASEADNRQYLKVGHGPDVIKDLQRGKWPIGATLDLHGDTVDDARERFERFLTSCLTHDIKCVRIVHGKGIGSRDGNAVLKTAVRRWLTQLPEVIAYTECSPSEGGSGAVQALLQ